MSFALTDSGQLSEPIVRPRRSPVLSPRDSEGHVVRVEVTIEREIEDSIMLWTILLVLLVLWALGLGFGVAGNLVHMLLVVAAIVLIVQLLQGRSVA
jgi:hypothetical protein